MAGVAGGVPAVVRQLSEHLSLNGIQVQIAHATGEPGELSPGVEVFTWPPAPLGRLWSWGRGLQSGLAQLATALNGDTPVFHVHGVWSAPQYFAARAAHEVGTPFVFTAHGMLEPWLWDQQGWRVRVKKMAYWSSLAYPSFSKAQVIHAITPLEQRNLARLFPDSRIEVIPNAIEVSNFDDFSHDERSKTILFLGRIDPKKGVDVLLRAFACAKISKEWSVDIVGPTWSRLYMAELKAITSEFGLDKRVRFHGPLFGEAKRRLIDSAWVMAVPSHSEAVGLVNLEAAARCLPTITTPQTGLHDWELGGGLLVEPTIDAFRRALEITCSWSKEEQHDRGLASLRLVRQRYSWQAVTPKWTQLYSSIRI